MADDNDIIRNRLLTLAADEAEIYLRKLSELYRRSANRPDALIEDLRRIPSDDMSKKRELAAFFGSEQGQRYSTSERRQAYDDLLGRERNREAR